MTRVEGPIESFNDEQTAYENAKMILSKYPNIKGFQGSGSTDTPGIARAVREAGLANEICVMGTAVPAVAAKYLADGAIDRIFFWDPAMAGEAALQIALMLAQGERSSRHQSKRPRLRVADQTRRLRQRLRRKCRAGSRRQNHLSVQLLIKRSVQVCESSHTHRKHHQRVMNHRRENTPIRGPYLIHLEVFAHNDGIQCCPPSTSSRPTTKPVARRLSESETNLTLVGDQPTARPSPARSAGSAAPHHSCSTAGPLVRGRRRRRAPDVRRSDDTAPRCVTSTGWRRRVR